MIKTLAGLASIALLAVFLYLNGDKLAALVATIVGTGADVSASVPASPYLVAVSEPRERFALLDPTTSTDASFRESMKAQLVEAVLSYVPPKPAVAKDGVPGLVGIHLVVRLVGTVPLAYGQPNYEVVIPSISALSARPDMTAPGALDPGSSYARWVEAEAAWGSQYDSAVASAVAAAVTLDGIDLERDEYSAVTAGLTALTLLAPEHADVAYLVMSDLDDNQGQQSASFTGDPVTVIQPDNVGDVARWDALFASFSGWATANGAGPLVQLRPEQSALAITAFIKGT